MRRCLRDYGLNSGNVFKALGGFGWRRQRSRIFTASFEVRVDGTEQRGRIGGFQKFQVRTSLASLNDTKEALTKARGVINDVDYAAETAELNRQNILMQSAISLLGVASQQSSQVLSLLR